MPTPPESVVRVRVRRVVPGVLAGVLALGAASCSDGATSGSPPLTQVVRVEIELDADSVLVGDSVTARARTLNRENAVVTPPSIAWSSADTTVGSISGGGVVRGRNLGAVMVTLVAGGVTAVRTLRIVARPITMTLASPDTVNISDAVDLRASVTTAAGVPLPEVAPRFASSDSMVVTVAPLSVGRAQVTLRTGGQADLLAIVGSDTTRRRLTVRLAALTSIRLVIAPRTVDLGDSVPFTLIARNAAGEAVSALGTVLTTETAGLVTVRKGYLIGAAAGRTVVRAAYGPLTSRDTLTTLAASTFQLDLVDGNPQNPLPERVVASMSRVTQKWRRVIRTSPPGEFVRLALNECRNSVPIAQFVPGLRVLIKLDTLATRIAGQGGPCLVRDSGLPLLGTIQINALTWSQLSDRKLDDLIQHEVGHVLGIGSIWLFPPQSQLVDGDMEAPDPIFTGPGALTAFGRLENSAFFSGRRVPLEVRVRGHWRASAFGGEVMAPVLVAAPQVTSAVTVAALQDFGWTVELESYDEYALPAAVLSQTVSPRVVGESALPAHSLEDDVLLPQLLQTASGRRVPIGSVMRRPTRQR